jgi:hypothetical protein
MQYSVINPFIFYPSRYRGQPLVKARSSILSSLSQLALNQVNICHVTTSSSSINVSLRHDVDARLDLNLRFAELEYSKNLRGTYYIIIPLEANSDICDYNYTQLKPFVRYLKEMGHKVGLHSIAWSHDNPLIALQNELNIFSNLLEEPFSLTSKELLCTHHGFPTKINVRWARLRLEFLLYLNFQRFLYRRRKIILSDSRDRLSCPYSSSFLRINTPYEICFHPQYWF